ncbi:MAG: FtsW/RodA/SpoVE family cell cycle protein [Epsilonproteobacteria bacterium]|nr:FtsW/RodA/SpoVE family cell cycle protein [Campylobacterota bacterium]
MSNKLYFTTIVLLMLSLVLTYSMSLFSTTYFNTSKYFFLQRQFLSITIAIILLTLISRMNPYNVFKPLGFLLFFGSSLAIIAMLFLPDSVVRSVLGAKRWIKFGPISIAPTEFFKYGFIFFIAWSLDRRYKIVNSANGVLKEYIYILPYFLVFIIASGIIAVGQKDLGQVVVLFGSLLALLYLTGVSKKFFISILVLFGAGVYALIKLAPHRISRFKGWWVGIQDYIPFLPDSLKVNDTTIPMHITNSLNAIHNGGAIGEGLGNGQFKLGYLSEVHTDFILAGAVEEIGVIGMIVLLGLMLFLIKLIFDIANRLEERIDKFFVYGVGIVLSLEFIINAFGITGIIPIKGMAVPLLSYGGSQIIATSIAIGMVLMLSKKIKKDENG